MRLVSSGLSEGRGTPEGEVTFLGVVGGGSEAITFTEDVQRQHPNERLLLLVGATVWSPDSSGDVTLNQTTFGDNDGIDGACWKIGGVGFCGFTAPIDFEAGYSYPGHGSGPGAGFKFRAYTCSVRKNYRAGETITLPTTGSVSSVQTFVALFSRAGTEFDTGVEGNWFPHAAGSDDPCIGGFIEDNTGTTYSREHIYLGVTYAVGIHEMSAQSPGRFSPMLETFDPGTPSWDLTELMNSEGSVTHDTEAVTDNPTGNPTTCVARVYWGFKLQPAGTATDEQVQWACPGTWSITGLPGGPFASSLDASLVDSYIPQNDVAPCCPRGVIVHRETRITQETVP